MRRVLMAAVVGLLLSPFAEGQLSESQSVQRLIEEGRIMPEPMNKSVLFVIASQDFRDEEFTAPYEALKTAGAKLSVASSRKGPARGMLGKVVDARLVVKDARAADYDAVIFIGGSGAQEFFDDPAAHRLAKDTVQQGKLLAAICIAPATLANAGVLQGKKATCFPSVERTLQKGGATLVRQNVVQDGKLITAPGPQAASAFAAAVLAALQ